MSYRDQGETGTVGQIMLFNNSNLNTDPDFHQDEISHDEVSISHGENLIFNMPDYNPNDGNMSIRTNQGNFFQF